MELIDFELLNAVPFVTSVADNRSTIMSTMLTFKEIMLQTSVGQCGMIATATMIGIHHTLIDW